MNLISGGNMQTALELNESLYDRAKQAAVSHGVSVAEFITEAIEEKLRTQPRAGAGKQRVRLPLVPSAHPGAAQLTAERVAEILSENDGSR